MGEILGFNPEIPQPFNAKDEWITIEKDKFTFSRETQRFLPPDAVSDYECDRSVIIINEPHQSVSGHYQLYRGLQQFFKDNPKLLLRTGDTETAFLAEGVPVNRLVDMSKLKGENWHPTARDIQAALNSYLITGYMAYDWEQFPRTPYGIGIPIIGTEDKELYEMSKYFGRRFMENPKQIFNTYTLKDDTTHHARLDTPWDFAIVARNKSIAKTLIWASREYKNPILFVGGGHVFNRMSNFDYTMVLHLAEHSGGSFGPLWNFAQLIGPHNENKNIYDYLKEARIGYTFLNPNHYAEENVNEDTRYLNLFRTQCKGPLTPNSDKDYDNYRNNLLNGQQQLDKKKLHYIASSTTVEPAPSQAVQYFRERDGAVYDRKEVYRNFWYRLESEVDEKLGRDTLWSEHSTTKIGFDFEVVREANITINNRNHPVADDIRAYEGIATSMKTINLHAPTYQNPKNVFARGKDYVDDFFSDKFKDGINMKEGYKLPRDQIKGFHLDIGIPFGATEEQEEQIYRIQEYGWEKGVEVYIGEVK